MKYFLPISQSNRQANIFKLVLGNLSRMFNADQLVRKKFFMTQCKKSKKILKLIRKWSQRLKKNSLTNVKIQLGKDLNSLDKQINNTLQIINRSVQLLYIQVQLKSLTQTPPMLSFYTEVLMTIYAIIHLALLMPTKNNGDTNSHQPLLRVLKRYSLTELNNRMEK